MARTTVQTYEDLKGTRARKAALDHLRKQDGVVRDISMLEPPTAPGEYEKVTVERVLVIMMRLCEDVRMPPASRVMAAKMIIDESHYREDKAREDARLSGGPAPDFDFDEDDPPKLGP